MGGSIQISVPTSNVGSEEPEKFLDEWEAWNLSERKTTNTQIKELDSEVSILRKRRHRNQILLL
jgi:hypothetical protein